MSDMESHTGKLIPMHYEGATLEERAEKCCNEFGFAKSSFHKSWEECLRDEGYRQIYILDNIIYKVDDEELDPFGFATATRNEDGSINYNLMYYNGGASFTEALDGAIEYMQNKET